MWFNKPYKFTPTFENIGFEHCPNGQFSQRTTCMLIFGKYQYSFILNSKVKSILPDSKLTSNTLPTK